MAVSPLFEDWPEAGRLLEAAAATTYALRVRHGARTLVFAGAGLEGVLGVSLARLPPGMWLDEVVHPRDRDSLVPDYHVLRTKSDVMRLVRVRDGEGWRWIHQCCRLVGGTPDDYVVAGFVADGEQHHAREELLRRHQESSRLSFDWHWRQDENLRFTWFSDEFMQLTGIDMEKVIGKTRWEGLGVDAREEEGVDWRSHRETLERRLPFRDFEYPSRTHPDRLHWFRTSGRPTFDGEGRFSGYMGVACDITDRRLIEDELRRVSAQQKTILENASLGIIMTRARVIQSCNPRAAQLLGYERDELLGRPGITVFPSAESYERLGAEASPLLAAGRSFETEIELRRKDGATFWARIFAKAVDPRHTDEGTIWLVEDIAEKRAVREALHQTLVEMEAVMTNASVGILFTKDRRITRYNRRFAEMFGFRDDEGLGMPGRTLYASQEAYDRLGSLAAPLLSQGKAFHTELEMRRQDDTTFWAQLIGYVVDPADPSRGTIWVIEDRHAEMVQRRRSEASIRKLSHAVEQSPAATVITDVDGRIEYVNPKFTQVSGYTLDEVCGKTPAVIKSGLTPPELYEDLWRTIKEGREWRGEMRNRRKNGELYWESQLISPLKNERGEIANFIAVKEDITERKRIETELVRMNRTLRMISECNEALVMTKGEPDLLNAICKIIVQMGGYPFAWVGYAEHDAKMKVVPVATSGRPGWDLSPVIDAITWGNEPKSEAIGGIAIRTGNSFIANDILVNPRYEHWRATFAAYGVSSAISLPLRSERGEAFGMLTIYSSERDGFTLDEADLLQEMADDLGYGITSLRIAEEHRRAAEKVRNLHIEQESILENTGVGIAFLRERRVIRCNRDFGAMFGYERDELLARTTQRLYPSRQASDEQEATVYPVVEQGGRFSGDIQLRRKDGTVFWASHNLTAIDRNDLAKGVIWVVQDITARKQADEAMRVRDRAIESSLHGIMISDACAPDRPIIYVNPAFERITGFAAEEVLGRNGRILVRDDMDQIGLVEIRSALREGRPANVVTRCFRKDASAFWSELSVSQVRDANGRVTHTVTIVNDVTDRVRYEEDLAHQAHHDSLTGLANRHLLADRLDQAIAGAQRHGRGTAVIYLDCDHFKIVNDSLGHRAGDELIRQLALRLSACVRETDTLARVGGDEFVMVVCDVEQGEQVAMTMQRVQEALAGPFRLEGHDIYTTCSMGASVFPKDGVDGQALLKNADAAMYQAKEQGRNQYRFYTAEMNEAVGARLALTNGIRRALEREEFALHYQPVVDLGTGRVVGAEALVRWNHPELGLLDAGKFVPAAEDTGLIVPLGKWVLETACAQNAAWQRAGLPPVTVAVNLSARQFHQERFSEFVEQVLRKHGLQPGWIELELTESLLMENIAAAVTTLRTLSILGVCLALDDFGTGYSSLSYLKRFPFNKLKIDQSFVRDLTRDPDDAAIVMAIIALAKSLNLKVVGEGVETREQLGYLQRHHCDAIQGHYFSRPLPADAFAELLRSGRGLE